MAKYRVTSPEGETFEITAPEGAADDEVMQYAQQQWAAQQKQAPEPGFGEKVNAGIANIPRQLGLTGRHLVEGTGKIADIVGAPIASTLNYLDPTKPSPASPIANALDPIDYRFSKPSENARAVADKMGLPTPNTPTERVVGDMSQILTGAGGMVKGAQLASGTSLPIIKTVLPNIGARSGGVPMLSNQPAIAPSLAPLATRPGLQAASAIGAGGAGGYTRETGGTPAAQFLTSIAGGVLAPATVAGVGAAGNFVRNTINSIRDVKPPQVNIQITQAIQQAGYNPASVPKRVMNQLEDDAAAAMRQGNLSPDALRRLVDYRLVGATPARGNLTQNPVDITQQQNLAKIGANSSNPTLQGLAMRQNETTGTLLRNMNEMGANTTDDAFAAGQRVIGGLSKTVGTRQGQVKQAYQAARDSTGRDIPLDRESFVYDAYSRLAKENKGGFLSPEVKSTLETIRKGKINLDGDEFDAPFTVDTIDTLKTILSNESRKGGNSAAAARIVRNALDDVKPSQPLAGDALRRWDTARALNRQWRTMVDKTPALQAIEDGVQPDKFVQQYIIQGTGKANVMDVARLKNAVKDSPEALQAIRGQILKHLKSKATSGSDDEAMKFSQSGYNNAFSGIGERKLRMFFTRAEIDRMKAIGRVAMYEQNQPSGSAVNNSNTAALAIGRLDELMGKIPVVGVPLQFGLTTPAKNIVTSIQAGGVANVPKAINMPQPVIPGQRIPLPLLMTPGLLEDRRN